MPHTWYCHPSASASTSKQTVQNDALFSTDENYQLDTVVTFDDDQINSDVSIDDSHTNRVNDNNAHIKPLGSMTDPDSEL